MNEKGSSLFLVLITVTVFMILGLSILTVSLSGALRTENRLNQYEDIYASKESLDYIIVKFKEEITKANSVDLSSVNAIPTYEEDINNILISLGEGDKFFVKDLTEDLSGLNKGTIFTRILEFSMPINENNISRNVIKRVILTPTPSFLDYAVGSYGEDDDSGVIKLNGSPTIDGNIISNHLHIKNRAEYIDINENSSSITPFPAISGYINIQRSLNFKNHDTEVHLIAPNIRPEHILSSFFYDDKKPTIHSKPEDFVEVAFENTYLDNLQKLLGMNFNMFDLFDPSLEQLRNYVSSQSYEIRLEDLDDNTFVYDKDIIRQIAGSTGPIIIDHHTDISSAFEEVNINQKLIINGDLNITASFSNPIKITNDIVVLGDLNINSYDTPIEFEGTVIVHGNLNVSGDEEPFAHNRNENDRVKFNSVFYVWGESFISNTNIEGVDENTQLVLLSRGDLTITRINEFAKFNNVIENEDIYNIGGDEISPLKAFFYTEGKAELYGVGSLFYINGGLFAKRELVVNAVRGNVEKSNRISVNLNEQLGVKSRFHIVHDPTVLVSQMSRLPLTNKLRFIVQDTVIK